MEDTFLLRQRIIIQVLWQCRYTLSTEMLCVCSVCVCVCECVCEREREREVEVVGFVACSAHYPALSLSGHLSKPPREGLQTEGESDSREEERERENERTLPSDKCAYRRSQREGRMNGRERARDGGGETESESVICLSPN